MMLRDIFSNPGEDVFIKIFDLLIVFRMELGFFEMLYTEKPAQCCEKLSHKLVAVFSYQATCHGIWYDAIGQEVCVQHAWQSSST